MSRNVSRSPTCSSWSNEYAPITSPATHVTPPSRYVKRRTPGATDHLGAVGHLENVGHVGRGARVEDRDRPVVVDHVEHRRNESAGADGDRLARFEVDIDRVAACQRPHERDEALDVIARRGDVVAAAQVDPPHTREVGAELLLDGGERAL